MTSTPAPRTVLLRSSWATVNIGVAHSPVTMSSSSNIWWDNVTVRGPVALTSDATEVLIDSSTEGPLSCGPGTLFALIGTTATGLTSGCG